MPYEPKRSGVYPAGWLASEEARHAGGIPVRERQYELETLLIEQLTRLPPPDEGECELERAARLAAVCVEIVSNRYGRPNPLIADGWEVEVVKKDETIGVYAVDPAGKRRRMNAIEDVIRG